MRGRLEHREVLRPSAHRRSSAWVAAGLLGILASTTYAASEAPPPPSRAALEERAGLALAAGRDARAELAALAAAPPAVARRPLPTTRGTARALDGALVRLRQAVAATRGSARAHSGDTADLLAAWDQARAADLALRTRFRATRERLAQAGIAGAPIARLDDAERTTKSAIDAILAPLAAPLAELRRAGPGAVPPELVRKLTLALVAAEAALAEGEAAPAPPRILGANGLPYRSLQLAPRAPMTAPAIQPIYLGTQEAAATPADLAGTVDAPLAPAIVDEARALGFDPVKLYERVHDGIATEHYAGAMKGAVETLRQGAGNDVDQASLLIALFRAASLPAHYVHGVIELPVDFLAASLGVPAAQVPTALARAGVANAPVVRGGRVAAVQVEHTWVAAQIPYTNYRGAVVDFSGKTWLPLMPAVKSVNVTAPSGVLRQMAFDSDAAIASYLAAPQPDEPLSQVRRRALDYLHLQSPGAAAYQQALGTRTVRSEHLGLLPSSLPATVVAVTGESSALATAFQQRVHLVVRATSEATSAVLLDATLPLAELAGRRVTLSYQPATVDDQRVVNAWGGLQSVPVYLVHLRPQLKVDGRTRALGTGDLPMGQAHRVEIELLALGGRESLAATAVAGSYQAIAIGAQRAARIAAAEDPAGDEEELGAHLLAQEALGYTARWDDAERELAGLFAVSVVRPLPSVAVVTDEVTVDSLLGLPFELHWRGVTLDAQLRIAEPTAVASDTAAARNFLRLSALEGSALEHFVFEDDFLVDSISADKGLGLARAAGVPVLAVTAANAATVLPTLAQPAAVVDDVRNWTRLGMTVEIPRTAITRAAWQGAVWRVEDPRSGAAGYFLAGGWAGGATAQDPGSWVFEFARDALAGPYSADPQRDPLAAVEVVKVTGSDQQTGEVGKAFPLKLAVLVRAADGRPVKDATVTFAVGAGGGTLIAADGTRSSALAVPTDSLGMAGVSLESGKRTADNAAYVLRQAGDEQQTRALLNVVDATVASPAGTLVPDRPFEELGFPGPPAVLRRTNPATVVPTPNDPSYVWRDVDSNQVVALGNPLQLIHGWAGTWADQPQVAVEDALGNPVSNVEVTFTAGRAYYLETGGCGRPDVFRHAAVFGSCAVSVPLLGDCGLPSVTVRSSFRGASAGVLLQDHIGTIQDLTITAASLPPVEQRYWTNLFFSVPGLQCGVPPGTFHLVVPSLVDEQGHNLNATRPGTTLREPLQMRIFYSVPDSGAGGGVHWQPTSGTIELRVDNYGASPPQASGSASPVEYLDFYLERSSITAGPLAGSNQVTFSATHVRTIDEQRQTTFRDMEPRVVANVYGVLPTIVAADPTPMVLGDNGVTLAPTSLHYTIAPPEYTAGAATVELLAQGVRTAQLFGTSPAGQGIAAIPRGQLFDRSQQNTAEAVLNPGSAVEVRGDSFPLPLYQHLIVSARGPSSLFRDVDLPSRGLCEQDPVYRYELAEDARVTLKLRQVLGPSLDGGFDYGPETTILNDQAESQGEHSLELELAALTPGQWQWRMTAVSQFDGHSEDAEGVFDSSFSTHGSLWVGHTSVQDVNLYDGTLNLERDDLSLPGRGVALELRRSYSSTADEPGPLGAGWDHNYDSRIVTNPCGEVILLGGEGSGMRFVADGSGGLRPLRGYHGSLVANAADHTFDFYSKSGNRFHYGTLFSGQPGEAVWYLSFIADPNGNRTSLDYERDRDGRPRLAAVRDGAGRALLFHYERKVFGLWQGDVITSIEGPLGFVESFSYDRWGNQIRAVREPQPGAGASEPAAAESYEYALPPAHRFDQRHVMLTAHDERRDATWRYTVERGVVGLQGDVQIARNFISSVTRPEGGVYRFAFASNLGDPAAAELEVKVTDPREKVTTYTLNPYGNALSIVDPLGHATTQTWAADDVLLQSRTDGNGVKTDYTYDAFGNVSTETVQDVVGFDGQPRDLAVVTTYWPPSTFEPPYVKERVRTRTDRNGVETRFTYDLHGNLLTQTTDVRSVDEAARPLATVHTYLPNGDRQTTTDPRGKTTRFGYDAYGNLASVTDPLGHTTRVESDPKSRPIRQTDALGRETLLAYDTLDRLTKKTLPPVIGEARMAEETTVYDDAARTVTRTDANGHATTTTLDREGRPIRIDNAAQGSKELGYDPAGNKKRETTFGDATTPAQETTFDYDDAGRLQTRHEPLGRTTAYGYDGVGNVTSETLRDASDPTFVPRVTEHEYDGLNRLVLTRRLTEAEPQVTRFGYDGENKTVEEDPLGRLTRYRYDELDRLIETTEPEWAPGKPKVTQRLYDGAGHLIEERALNEPKNRVRTFEYDDDGRLEKTTDGTSGTRVFEYDAVDDKRREIDARLDVVSFDYDERHRLTGTTQYLDRVSVPTRRVETTFDYDAVGNRTEERLPNGDLVRHRYDELDRLEESTDSLGALSTTTYDARGNRTQTTDGRGSESTHTYDALDRLIAEDLPEGRHREITWDVAGNKLTDTDPRTKTTRYRYDRLDRLVEVDDPPPGNTTTSFTYDLAGNKRTQTDRRGKTTRFDYDPLDRLIQTTDPAALGTFTTATYDALGNRLTETDRRGLTTTTAYDAEGRPNKESRAGVTLRETTYDGAGNVIIAKDANQHTTTYEYDERNLLLTESRPLAAITRYTLDDMGDRTSVVDPEGRTTTSVYDKRRRLSSETNAAHETTSYEHDGNGNRTAMVHPKSTHWTYAYDLADRLISVTDPLSKTTSYGYDGNGNRISQTDANSHLTTFEYDERNRETARVEPLSARWETDYDGNGNVKETRDPNGAAVSMQYDDLNREILRTYPAPDPGRDGLLTIATQHDGNGNPTQTTETYSGPTGTRITQRTYDDFDREETVTDPKGKKLTYEYDAAGNRKTLTDPDGKVTRYTFDDLNRTATVSVTGAGVTEYSYFRDSRLKKVLYPSGTAADHLYDPAGRLQQIANTHQGATVSRYDYLYDKNGNRTSQIEENGSPAETTTYGYDDADRLLGVTYPDEAVAYTYDAVGNRKTEVTRRASDSTVTSSKTFGYDDRDRVLSVTDAVDSSNNTTYAYDANGNQTVRTQGGVTTDFIFDVRNQIIEVRRGGTLLEAYAYDAGGLRIRKAGAGGIVRYVYDDQSVLVQTDDAGNTIAKFDYGPDRLLSLNHATEGRSFYLFDALGSPVTLTTTDGGVRARYRLDAWGNTRSETGSSWNPFSLTGYEKDSETGLLYAKARFYDPELGRFTSEDLFEGVFDRPPSLHRYLYAFNDPTIYTDPTGLLTAGEWLGVLWDTAKETAKDAGKVAVKGAKVAAVGVAVAAVAGAVAVASPVVAVAAVGGLVVVGVGNAIASRVADDQNAAQAIGGGVADFTGVTAAVAATTDRDIATGRKLNLTHDQRVDALGTVAGTVATLALAGPAARTGATGYTAVADALSAGEALGSAGSEGLVAAARELNGPPPPGMTSSVPIQITAIVTGESGEGGVGIADIEATRSVLPVISQHPPLDLPPSWQSTPEALELPLPDRDPVIGVVRPYNEARANHFPGYDDHHLDPRFSRNDPTYDTGPTTPVRNDNAGGRVPGGVNMHTAKGGFQDALRQYITNDLGYSMKEWDALPNETRILHLRRYYAALGIPFPK